MPSGRAPGGTQGRPRQVQGCKAQLAKSHPPFRILAALKPGASGKVTPSEASSPNSRSSPGPGPSTRLPRAGAAVTRGSPPCASTEGSGGEGRCTCQVAPRARNPHGKLQRLSTPRLGSPQSAAHQGRCQGPGSPCRFFWGKNGDPPPFFPSSVKPVQSNTLGRWPITTALKRLSRPLGSRPCVSSCSPPLEHTAS